MTTETQDRHGRLLTPEQVAILLNVGVQSVAKMVKRGELPRPIKLHARANRWRASDIEAHLAKLEKEGAK